MLARRLSRISERSPDERSDIRVRITLRSPLRRRRREPNHQCPDRSDTAIVSGAAISIGFSEGVAIAPARESTAEVIIPSALLCELLGPKSNSERSPDERSDIRVSIMVRPAYRYAHAGYLLGIRPCTHKPSDVMRRTQCLLCPYSDRVRAAAQYVVMGQSRRPLLGRSDLPFKDDMRRQTDSIASANVEFMISAAHHLGSVRPLLRGHRSQSG